MRVRSATAGAGAFSRKGRVILVAAALLAVVAALGVAGGKKEAAAPAGNSTAATPLVTSPGVLVTAVEAGSPADKAGIQRGDIILEADGKAVNTPPELAAAINARKSGDTLRLKLRHGDTEKTVSVSLSDLQGRAWLGIAAAGGHMGLGTGRGLGGFGGGQGRFGGPLGPGNGLRGGPGMMLGGAGAYVTAVTAGGPAEKAGVVQGDFILAVDGTAVDAQHALTDLIGAKKAGDTVTLSVQSAAQPQARDVKVTLGRNPDKDAAWLGVQYSLIGPRMGRPFGGTGRGFGAPGFTGNGIVVAEVAAGSPAEKAGLKASDLIAKVDGTAVTDPQQVVDAVAKHKPGDTITVTVTRSGSDVDVSVVLGASPADAAKAYMGVSMSAVVQRAIPNAPAQGGAQGGTAGGSPNTL